MGYEAMREQTLANQKKLGIVPDEHRAASDQPDRHARDAQGPDGQPFPMMDYTPALGLARRRREAAVLPLCRGVRRLPRARRPPDRTAARLPRGDRAARQHADRARLRQRRERRGRPDGVGERDEVRERRPRRSGGEPREDRRSRQREDVQPLPERLGDGLQHAVQDVEALRVQRRHVGPVHRRFARRQERRRAARAVLPRDRHRAHHPRPARGRAAGDDQGAHAECVRRPEHPLDDR